MLNIISTIDIKGHLKLPYEDILTEEALRFVATLHRSFNQRRKDLLLKRVETQNLIDQGNLPEFLNDTKSIRDGEWQVAPIPEDLQDRRTEITGPVDRKMIINALNSGAKVFMADFEDSNAPTWENCLNGQINLRDAVRRNIDFEAENGKFYSLKEQTAVLKVRPRGWHLEEKHLLVDGEPVSASLFDFGLYFFHNAKQLLDNGSGPYFYLPKLENHQEARLWNDVFIMAQELLDIPVGTIKATVLIETILAAFEMDEIIYVLKDHIAGLNAGRWDYIFSFIKKFRNHKAFLLPDRGQITMTVPFMKAYAELLVKTCHRRGAHAIGGMSAFIPAKDEEINKKAFEKVKADKALEAGQGYDGTWVAHPFLVPVAMKEFNRVLGVQPHQKHNLREDVMVTGSDLINPGIKGGSITEAGLRTNVNVGILYLESWLGGTGAAALYNLMEDVATAEISRAQVWQWYHLNGVKLADGQEVTEELYHKILNEEKLEIKRSLGEERVAKGYFDKACILFDNLVSSGEFKEFLTLDAYNEL